MIDLDHLGLATADLDAARDIYRRLGFTLTAKSTHQGPVPPHGETGAWGSGNYCMMFERGYFELIGVTDPALPHPLVASRLEKYAGLHIIALGCQDGDAEASALNNRAAGLVADQYELGRDVPQGVDGACTREGRFRIYQIDDGIMPEADFFLVEHMTRDVLWQPALTTHANGVTGLRGVNILVDDVDRAGARFSPLFDQPGEGSQGALCFQLDSGSVSLIDGAALGLRYPGVVPPCTPWVAAVEFAVSDIEALTSLLADNGITATPTDDGAVWITPEQAAGAVVRFSAA